MIIQLFKDHLGRYSEFLLKASTNFIYIYIYIFVRNETLKHKMAIKKPFAESFKKNVSYWLTKILLKFILNFSKNFKDPLCLKLLMKV